MIAQFRENHKSASPVTRGKTMSRNARYEEKKRASGLVKKTLWVPAECLVEFEKMAKFCCDNREFVPFMAKSTVTGKFRKGV